MSAARNVFLRRVASIHTAIRDYGLHDLPLSPANESRNASVRMIRIGLAIQCFNILEDFLKARTAEALSVLSAARVHFDWLPEQLREAATLGVVRAISTQSRRRDRSSRIQYSQMYSAKIASTQTGAMDLAEIGCFHVGSNISADEIQEALSAFGVARPWDQLSGIVSRVGLSGIPARTVFQSLATRRHEAAHEPSTSVTEMDLQQGALDAMATALGFDLIISRAVALLGAIGAPMTNIPHVLLSHQEIPLRFIRARGREFCELTEGGKRSVAKDRDWMPLLADARRRAKARSEALIIIGHGPVALDWFD